MKIHFLSFLDSERLSPTDLGLEGSRRCVSLNVQHSLVTVPPSEARGVQEVGLAQQHTNWWQCLKLRLELPHLRIMYSARTAVKVGWQRTHPLR